jgi:hypothetical protein
MTTLPTAPNAVLSTDGQAYFGKFAGEVEHIDWVGLAAPYARSGFWRHFHHKRWQYVALATEKLFCGIAIVDLGWTNTAFAYAFDREQRKEVGTFSQDGIPGLCAHVDDRVGPGAASHFHFFKNKIDFQRMSDTNSQGYRLSLRCGAFEIDAQFDAATAAPSLLAVGPIEKGAVHSTQKSAGMPLQGEVRASGRRYDLAGGVASCDYSNGFLARKTQWRWASAHSLDLGFNLQAGYFGNAENVLWLDGQLISLNRAQFDFNHADPMAPWHIHTDDGLLDLQFQPEGLRRENKNLVIASSYYVQPIGTFNGWVKSTADAAPRAVKDLVGVTEDHQSRW